MAQHNDLGKAGETLAANFLREKCYILCESQYRYKKSEIDIIAKTENILVFIEVKTRSSAVFGEPEEQISTKKQEMMIAGANAYIEEKGWQGESRFDVISIILSPSTPAVIKHIEDAFYPFGL
ncbi:MAG: YraN family protein [Bacteroidetes bacterium]|nr:YraN family protein [Bacteroidota bacterium]